MRRGEDEFAIHVPAGVAVEFERTNFSRSRAGVGFNPPTRNTYWFGNYLGILLAYFKVSLTIGRTPSALPIRYIKHLADRTDCLNV